MKTLIAYASRYGTTRRCAEEIARQLPQESVLVDLRRDPLPPLADIDRVVIGGPIYGGKIMRAVPTFCERHRDELLERMVALYVCCLYEGETAARELDEAFPPWLKAHAAIRRAVGGAIRYQELSAVDRYLVRRVARVGGDLDTVKPDELRAIVSALGDQRTSSTSSPKTRGR